MERGREYGGWRQGTKTRLEGGDWRPAGGARVAPRVAMYLEEGGLSASGCAPGCKIYWPRVGHVAAGFIYRQGEHALSMGQDVYDWRVVVRDMRRAWEEKRGWLEQIDACLVMGLDDDDKNLRERRAGLMRLIMSGELATTLTEEDSDGMAVDDRCEGGLFWPGSKIK